MRKRNLVIGAVAALIGALALSGVATGAVSSQTYSSVAAKTKQDKKKRGPVGAFATNVDTAYSGTTVPPGGAGCIPPGTVTPACKYFPPATQTVLTFDRAFKFDPGTLKQCNAASLTGKDAAGAKAACPKSVVGQGSARIHTLTEPGTPPGNAGVLNAVVTAFNGVKSGGNPVILLHTDVIGSTTKPILTGTLTANTLTVQVPVTPGTVIEHFDTTINQVVSKRKKNKKTGKVTKTFFVSAKCNDGSWDHSETTTFQDGSTSSDTYSQKCKKKKPKK
jgi:hypothetical protein